jgi:hypothetical protein
VAPGQAATLRVAGCPTVYGSSGPHPRPPASVVTRAPVPTADRLAAFGNGDLLVVGPRGWRCLAITGADGGARMTLWPPTRARPLRMPSPFAVVADVQPACVGCIADLTCAYFPRARVTGIPCDRTPRQETVRRLGRDAVVVSDASGRLGAVVYRARPQPFGAAVSCRTDESDAVCRAVVADFLRRVR